ncbi:MAG: 3-isopropylmalate dehydrogenase [Acidobacteria bacterium]|nr:3-isopropylmalate dehydrogenase [Acidobacteriota bacterium]MBK8812193.1 3-isopropylmalate dehydrogenase [Acidobacteriota bacterium]
MKITVLPGDGIGIEVTREAVKVLRAVAGVCGLNVETEEHLIGGAAIREAGMPLPEATRASCAAADAVLLGAVGAPEFDQLLPEERPEIGLLQLRQVLGGFANLRPAKAFPALIDSSPLRREIFEGTDLLIVRELLGGLYFGQPRAIGATEAYNTMRYSVAEVERVARVAFESARLRKKKVTSVDKANVLETSRLWRETVDRVARDYPDVEVEHLFVDACAMHLVTAPTRFDVILTENLFGDILSDEAAVLTGSLGMLASATVGGAVDLYEPVHGSAPDIAGKDIANPLGAIASVAMMLRHTAKNETAARAIEDAIDRVLAEGFRTADLTTDKSNATGTGAIGDLVAEYAAGFAASDSALGAA